MSTEIASTFIMAICFLVQMNLTHPVPPESDHSGMKTDCCRCKFAMEISISLNLLVYSSSHGSQIQTMEMEFYAFLQVKLSFLSDFI